MVVSSFVTKTSTKSVSDNVACQGIVIDDPALELTEAVRFDPAMADPLIAICAATAMVPPEAAKMVTLLVMGSF